MVIPEDEGSGTFEDLSKIECSALISSRRGGTSEKVLKVPISHSIVRSRSQCNAK